MMMAMMTVSMFAIITNYHCDNRVLHRHGHRRHAWHGHQQLQLDEDVNYSSASCNHHPLHAVSAEMHHAPPPARLPRSIVILPSALGTVPSLPLPGCSSAVGRGSIRWRAAPSASMFCHGHVVPCRCVQRRRRQLLDRAWLDFTVLGATSTLASFTPWSRKNSW